MHFPLRPSIPGLPSKSCLQCGHWNANVICRLDAGDEFSMVPVGAIVKMNLQLGHRPRVPSRVGSQTNTKSQRGHGTSSLISITVSWILGMVRMVWHSGHLHFLPSLPSGTRTCRVQFVQANSIGIIAWSGETTETVPVERGFVDVPS